MSLEIDPLATLVNGIHKLPEADWEALASIWSPFSARRKEILTVAGEKERYLYYYFETLTPSRFLRAPAKDFLELMHTRINISILAQQGITQSFSGLLERMVELQSFSAEDKFRNLMKRSPHILHLVPHKYLANYIGIDATNFSKLINKIKI